MSFEDWRAGVRAGLEQDCAPALRARDEAWHRACREIIARCVAPDMYGNAMAMLDRAMREANGIAGMRVVADPAIPADHVVFRDASSKELGRITGVGR